MGTFNKLYVEMHCPKCGVASEVEVQMKFSDTHHMVEVKIGDRYPWIPGESPHRGGRPEGGNMVGHGYACCERCEKDRYMRVLIRADVLEGVELDPEKQG